MAEYISRDWLLTHTHTGMDTIQMMQTMIDAPAADVVEEENILKFYYVRSIDEYWIGQRIDNFYYAEYDPKRRQWVWTHSRHLPWGEHIVSPTSLWKEHTYPSEPEEMPFPEWLQGFIKKHAADVRPVSEIEKIIENLQEQADIYNARAKELFVEEDGQVSQYTWAVSLRETYRRIIKTLDDLIS